MAANRILFLINSLAGGGAERVLMTLLAASRDAMTETPFELALLDEDPVAYPPPDWLGVTRLDTGGSLVAGLRRVAALVKKRRPRLIVSFLTRSNIIAVVIGRATGRKVIISERVNTSAHLSGRKAIVTRLLVRLTYRHAHRVIAVSQGVADDLRENFGVPASRLIVIGNPVDIDTITARSREDAELPVSQPYVVAMGRLTKTKNPALALSAYAESGIAPSLLILGDGPEREALEASVASLGLADKVRLQGFAGNPFPLLAGAEAYISPSNGEGFPNALVEAMALGLPVIATNCASGPSEILADRSRESISGTLETPYGFLVPTEDRTAMAAALRSAMQDRQRLARWGAAGRERAMQFSVARAAASYWQAFGAVLNG